nr:hypothetical protein [Tanacetum cinerariifolium]
TIDMMIDQQVALDEALVPQCWPIKDWKEQLSPSIRHLFQRIYSLTSV